MTFVAEASVVTKLFFEEDRSNLALSLFANAQREQEVVVAPYLLAGEFVNVIRRRMRRFRLPRDRTT